MCLESKSQQMEMIQPCNNPIYSILPHLVILLSFKKKTSKFVWHEIYRHRMYGIKRMQLFIYMLAAFHFLVDSLFLPVVIFNE